MFRSVPADEFAAFDEPDYVKIAWTLRADPVDDGTVVFVRNACHADGCDGTRKVQAVLALLLARHQDDPSHGTA